MRKKIIWMFLLMAFFYTSQAQQEIPLYTGGIPNSRVTPDKEKKVFNADVDTILSEVSRPTLRIYLPSNEKANGTGVIICPGGGYHNLCIEMEGNRIAKAFNDFGVAAFVLKYRLPSDKTMVDKSIAPLQDAQQAIKIVRDKAIEWNINPQKIGIMGFSAGGHLAATAGTHFNNELIDNKEDSNLRPDFMILVYPVISFTDSIGHIGSREYLLGKSPTKEQILFFSNEYHVSSSTPPTFITHAGDDTVVSIANSLHFYEALNNNLVPAALHIYSSGDHGYLKQPPFEEWFGRCVYWIKNNGF
ncbi:MAG: alpha/beta hydrolase [Bacteroidota bacterium]